MRARGEKIAKPGTPLVVLVFLVAGWISVRALTWDSPLAYPAMAKAPLNGIERSNGPNSFQTTAANQSMPAPQSHAYAQYGQYPQYQPYPPNRAYVYPVYPHAAWGAPPTGHRPYSQDAYLASPSHPVTITPYRREYLYPLAPDLALDRGRLLDERFSLGLPSQRYIADRSVPHKAQGKRYHTRQQARPPFGASPLPARQTSADRWLLDAYGFYRQGSSALSVTQGRQPIYGASQLAANLQWRARPSSSHDPRLYARAYHALVPGGESELATGVSALPFGGVPVRLYGELRATRNPAISDEGVSAKTNFRPAAYLATEIPPLKLPLGFSLESYGAGGYVGGNASTYFLDGQAVVARNLTRIGKPGIGSANVSLGAGVWGGAQEGVHRVDIGPTVRFDLNIGKVPARVSVDYREQVAGDAEPDSGVAATVSTRF